MNKASLLLPLFIMFCTNVTATEVYRYVDSQGVVHFTDHPITGNNGKSAKIKRPNLNIRTVRIYRFVDKNGTVHLADAPKNSKYKLIYSGLDSIIPSAGGRYSAYEVMSKKYKKYYAMVNNAADLTGVDAALLHAVIQTESAYNPKAVSPKGATGLMQLMPATARRFGVSDRTNASENIYGGAKYLSWLLDLFDNDIRLALAGYNAGEGAVKRYGNKIPPYKETKNYVRKVMGLYDKYRLKM
ncbi:lytic transglycosylase domain-containing protein [Candidatus Albibeggiatoa sp. nov. NOAA]|uniref:lytic transglycosylase domain-containing protein n=1 Tax=Candidatus Albibeggiatoa sp. nov. NOAA TaxID=3162724 RepID=UPI0033015CEE|nr:lytic transglycosylase domain-containing protein [Thiotrichaceae bacterium]